MASKIDIHMHICPTAFHGSSFVASPPPLSTPAGAMTAMDALGVSKAVFSCSVPGPAIAGNGQEGRALARACNEDCIKFCQEGDAGKLHFFAAMPSWIDVEGALAEIEWALVEKKLPGIVVMATYDNRLLGDALFAPIWDRLNELEAIVFIHPTFSSQQTPLIAGTLGQFVADFPHQTTRTAVDLVLSSTVTAHPAVKIILPHAGGTLPYLADKILAGCAGSTMLSAEETMKAFKSFYFDVALSTGRITMRALLEFAQPGHVLYGSDCTLCTPTATPKAMSDQLDAFLETQEGKALQGLNSSNAEALFAGKI